MCGRTRLDLVGPDNPLGVEITDPAARDDVWTQNQLKSARGPPRYRASLQQGVIHSFGLPQMRVKEDSIPGIGQRLWFTPTRTGELGNRMLAAMRPRALPHVRVLHGSNTSRFQCVARKPTSLTLTIERFE